MTTQSPQRMTSKEFALICRKLDELQSEIRDIKHGVHDKIDTVAMKVKNAFEGFGILDPDVDVWTEKEVCQRYSVCRRTMYTYREQGLIEPVKPKEGSNSRKIRYRKADVIELFASRDS